MTLRVTIEIVPHGDEEQKYPIATANIHNNGNCYLGLCEYKGSILHGGGLEESFEGLKHQRQDGPWALVKRVLNASERLKEYE